MSRNEYNRRFNIFAIIVVFVVLTALIGFSQFADPVDYEQDRLNHLESGEYMVKDSKGLRKVVK